MKIKFVLFFLIFSYSLNAGDFRGGDIHVEQYTSHSVQVNININLIIHSQIEQITICWGDGSCETLSSPQVLENPAIDTKTLHFYWIHQYSQHGFYEITVEECCWSNDIFNMNLNSEQNFKLSAYFELIDPQNGSYNVLPRSQSLPISIGVQDQYLVYNSLTIIPDGDESKFELCEVDVDNYFMLDELFGQPNTFYFDTITGGFTWFSPPAPGYFIVKACITTTRSGQLISETSRDILIVIDNKVGLSQLTMPENFDLNSYPNPAHHSIQLAYFLKENAKVEIELFNAQGQKIKTILSDFRNDGQNLEHFDISDLPSGPYFLKLQTKAGFGQIPFIKI